MSESWPLGDGGQWDGSCGMEGASASFWGDCGSAAAQKYLESLGEVGFARRVTVHARGDAERDATPAPHDELRS